MEDIKIIKDGISEVISKTQDVMNNFVERINLKKSEVNGIETIKKELKNVIGQLDKIKITIENFGILCNEMVDFLVNQQDDLSTAKYELIEENKLQLYELIHQNLPDKMYLKRKSDYVWEICLGVNETITKSRKKYNEPSLWENGRKTVGEIEVSHIDNQFVLIITIENEEKGEKFIVDNVLRVFPIVNHIHDRCHYKHNN